MIKYSEHPCGADGMSFPNGLPEKGQTVDVKTVWSGGKWETLVFQDHINYEKGSYDWFGVYAKPRVPIGNPIVLEWRPHKTVDLELEDLICKLQAQSMKTPESRSEAMSLIKTYVDKFTPTQWSYDRACDALNKTKSQLDLVSSKCRMLEESLEEIRDQYSLLSVQGANPNLITAYRISNRALNKLKEMEKNNDKA